MTTAVISKLPQKAMKIITRWATFWDIPEALSMLIANRESNHLDRAIFDYPTTKLIRAQEDSGEAVAYMPVQTAVILESLGFREDISVKEKLLASLAMLERTSNEAYAAGIRELYYISSDDRTDVTAMSEFGFEPVKAYRKRLQCG